MDEERPRKRHTQFSRAARTKRILEQLREGWAYDDIAREEGLTGRRVRQIVAEFLKAREALEGATHAHMQIDRLGRAMRVASDALARGDIRAIGPFIRVIDRLDRYQTLAQETRARPTPVEDQVIIQSLVARLKAQPGPSSPRSAGGRPRPPPRPPGRRPRSRSGIAPPSRRRPSPKRRRAAARLRAPLLSGARRFFSLRSPISH